VSETEPDDLDPNNLSDEELDEEIRARMEERQQIASDIRENDLAEAWPYIRLREKAVKKRNRLTAEADVLREILQKRRLLAINPTANPRGTAPDRHIELMRQQQELARIKEAEKTARLAILAPLEESRNRDRARLFVMAAAKMMDRPAFEAIWVKARELWPDSPAWNELPGEPKP
jgi:hypothetical protein